MADFFNIMSNTVVSGTDEADIIYNEANSYSTLRATNVVIYGYGGNDTIINYGTKVTIDGGTGDNYITNQNENVYIIAGNGSDTIENSGDHWTEGSNVTIDAGEGDNFINAAFAGDDGNISNVSIKSGSGDDVISIGEFSYFTVNSGEGNDLITSSADNSQIITGNGNKDVWINGGDNIIISTGNSYDKIQINTANNVTVKTGKADDDVAFADDSSNNSFVYNFGDGHDSIRGYTSTDTINIIGASYSSATVNNDIVITVGEGTDSVGTITLIDAAGNSVNIAGDGGSSSGGTTDTTPGSGTTETTSGGGTATNSAYDIVFLIDNTGSMSDYINNVKNNVTTFTNNLGNVDYRLGLVEFGDLYDSDIKTYEFTANSDEFLADLNAIELTDGEDWAESGLEALTEGMAMDFRDNAEKRFIAVTDAPYHNQGESGDGDSSSYLYVDDVVASLKEKGIVVDVVGTTYARYGTDSAQYEWDEPIASVTGGQFYDIEGDFPSLISDLAKNISGSGTPQMHLSRWSYEYTFPEATSDVPILTSST